MCSKKVTKVFTNDTVFVLENYMRIANIVQSKTAAVTVRDASDRAVFDAAWSADIIVSGDKDVLTAASIFPVLTPRRFLEVYL